MRKFTDTTIEQEMEIFGVLATENYTPVESKEYMAHIRKVARRIKLSVYFVWQTQRKYARATVNDVINNLVDKKKGK